MNALKTALLISSCLISNAAANPASSNFLPRPIPLPEKKEPPAYSLLVDIQPLSPYAGGEDLLIAHRFLEWAETRILPENLSAGCKDPRSRIERLLELICIWLPLNYEAMLIQHEVFGHGYRIFDLGPSRAKINGFHLGTPPPYGYGGGSTSYRIGNNVSAMEESAISSAGVEATAILANLTKFKWLQPRKIDAKQSVLYLFAQHDLSLYIGSLNLVDLPNDEKDSSHDIKSYLAWLNFTYPQDHLSQGRLKTLSWVNILDPFTVYSAFAWIKYLSSGLDADIPMIPIGEAGYLPGARLGLTPFGPEIFLENYVSLDGHFFYGYLKAGNHADNTYFGLGVFCPFLFELERWNVGIRFDAWRQPRLLFSPGVYPWIQTEKPRPAHPIYSEDRLREMDLGAAGSIVLEKHWKANIGIELEFGAKTQGFLPGNSLWPAPILRGGLTARF